MPSRAIWGFLLLLSVRISLAQEPAPPPPPAEPQGITPALTVGVLEVVGVSDGVQHFGVYATMGLGLMIPLQGTWALIPSLGFEFCPEFGNWGGTVFVTVDKLLYESEILLLALDPYVGLIHDAVPDGSGGFEHNFLLGGGIGPSFILGKTTLSPSLAAYVDLKSKTVVVNPTLLFSVAF